MNKFFRKIRQQLLNEGKTWKYLKYAIGEILLIMIGIFAALQLNNWNQKRLQEIEFKTTLEQLYNTISDDHHLYETNANLVEGHIESIGVLLNDSAQQLALGYPYYLWSLSFTSAFENDSHSNELIEDLNYDPQNKRHKNIARQLQSYHNLLQRDTPLENQFSQKINTALLKHNIPYPGFGLNDIQGGFIADSTYYSSIEIATAKELLTDPYFRSLLKSERTAKTFQTLVYREQRDDALAMMRIIKKYHPEVRLLIEDVGIIGTAINGFDDVGAKSTPLLLIDEQENIWEISMHLKHGAVKFRCRDSWAINWGGSAFPKGEAERHGQDIQIEKEGDYKIILNLTKNTYEFITLDD
ncbi:MAG: hypothetical protein BM563_10315 [Bacteroidetes bacterium MedPE-SWsnd-G1]|nr:MAG: hypothetical protein BM563_10315 [Bacteroidetes bacterium MedPE-SWsnd-G1]